MGRDSRLRLLRDSCLRSADAATSISPHLRRSRPKADSREAHRVNMPRLGPEADPPRLRHTEYNTCDCGSSCGGEVYMKMGFGGGRRVGPPLCFAVYAVPDARSSPHPSSLPRPPRKQNKAQWAVTVACASSVTVACAPPMP